MLLFPRIFGILEHLFEQMGKSRGPWALVSGAHVTSQMVIFDENHIEAVLASLYLLYLSAGTIWTFDTGSSSMSRSSAFPQLDRPCLRTTTQKSQP
jgi:hypothetical protein